MTCCRLVTGNRNPVASCHPNAVISRRTSTNKPANVEIYRLVRRFHNFYTLRSVLAGARTLDPMIKSHLLYQLSYEDLQNRRKGITLCGIFQIKTESPLRFRTIDWFARKYLFPVLP